MLSTSFILLLTKSQNFRGREAEPPCTDAVLALSYSWVYPYAQ